MSKRYGGTKNMQNLADIQEAVVYKKPPVHYSKWQILTAFLVVGAKMFLLVSAVMIALGGTLVLFGDLR